MKIILTKDVKSLGKKDEIKEVKDGYASYLISSNQAVVYSNKSLEILSKEITNRKETEEEKIKENNLLKSKLEKEKLIFKVKVGDNNKIFGSITNKLISEELNKKGYNIDKKKIESDDELNKLGNYKIKINLYSKIIAFVNVTLES